MIVRIWRTRVDPSRAAEYDAFARDVSLPMFRAQLGYRGVLMLRDGAECRVVTLWEDMEAIAALDGSESYQATVARILAAGFLAGEQSTEVWPAHLADFR